jgi:hypothetical protein
MRPIFFLHVPKTAGQTLQHILAPYFAPVDTMIGDWPLIQHRAQPSFRFVSGHLYLRDVSLIPWANHYRIVVLRDPMERAISHFYHTNERLARDGKIEDYAEHALKVGLNAAILDGSYEGMMDTAVDHLSSFSRATVTAESNVGSAMTNLRYFDAIGFVEDFEPFVQALCGRLGLGHQEFIPRINPPKWKPEVIELTDEARAKLRGLLEHDYWLYHYARRTFGTFRV